jgi:ribosomal protein L7Ae-like RNA K-turn-binding protein
MNNGFLQFLGLTKRAGKLVEGYNKCEEIMKKQTVYLLILSVEISQNTKDKFERYASEKKLELIQHYNGEELGSAIGRPEVNVLCVTDRQMAEKLVALYRTLENNRG